MKSSQENNNVSHDKASIDLPDQKIWKELEKCVVESSREGNQPMDCKKAEQIECLLNKAFDLLLETLIRQS